MTCFGFPVLTMYLAQLLTGGEILKLAPLVAVGTGEKLVAAATAFTLGRHTEACFPFSLS